MPVSRVEVASESSMKTAAETTIRTKNRYAAKGFLYAFERRMKACQSAVKASKV